ncbi:hypothetical protein Hanom_Chr06g00481171 [Helianthus anomalus]
METGQEVRKPPLVHLKFLKPPKSYDIRWVNHNKIVFIVIRHYIIYYILYIYNKRGCLRNSS